MVQEAAGGAKGRLSGAPRQVWGWAEPGKSEVYLLYWYKSTNTDANTPARGSRLVVSRAHLSLKVKRPSSPTPLRTRRTCTRSSKKRKKKKELAARGRMPPLLLRRKKEKKEKVLRARERPLRTVLGVNWVGRKKTPLTLIKWRARISRVVANSRDYFQYWVSYTEEVRVSTYIQYSSSRPGILVVVGGVY